MTWQPIETAPKDGTDVLLWGYCEGEICGRYDKPSMSVGAFRYNQFWIDTDTYSVTVDATHWMPLPEPPQ